MQPPPDLIKCYPKTIGLIGYSRIGKRWSNSEIFWDENFNFF